MHASRAPPNFSPHHAVRGGGLRPVRVASAAAPSRLNQAYFGNEQPGEELPAARWSGLCCRLAVVGDACIVFDAGNRRETAHCALPVTRAFAPSQMALGVSASVVRRVLHRPSDAGKVRWRLRPTVSRVTVLRPRGVARVADFSLGSGVTNSVSRCFESAPAVVTGGDRLPHFGGPRARTRKPSARAGVRPSGTTLVARGSRHRAGGLRAPGSKGNALARSEGARASAARRAMWLAA